MTAEAGKQIDVFTEKIFNGKLLAAPRQIVEHVSCDDGLICISREIHAAVDDADRCAVAEPHAVLSRAHDGWILPLFVAFVDVVVVGVVEHDDFYGRRVCFFTLDMRFADERPVGIFSNPCI